MNILISYIYVAHGKRSREFAHRFAQTYNFLEKEHVLLFLCNGGMPNAESVKELAELNPRRMFLLRENDPGWDISAFMCAADRFEYDMLVCLGESVWFHRIGWLERLVEAWEQFGPGFYGVFSSNVVRSHLQTTGFAIDPKLLRGHTVPQNRQDRYNFEHGKRALFRQVQALGLPVKLVTFDGVWDEPQWRVPQNILWRGDQSNLLFQCRHSDEWSQADEKTKQKWSRAADVGTEK